jgi:S-adenosylmethionine:tRNA ribosyltransferase-isomerase
MAGQAVDAASTLTVADFDFDLPPELIAQAPLPDRAASRLLQVNDSGLVDGRFVDLERLVEPGELLVFNDTRVIKARLFARKSSGAHVELLVERIVTPRRAWALVRTSHAPKPGAQFLCGDGSAPVAVTVRGRCDAFFDLEFDHDLSDVLDRFGHVPLPPYIAHADTPDDQLRYQTVFAKVPGAVAAPTAGLHFTAELLDRLGAKGVRFAYVTLHVGAATFQPVRVERIADHVMHSERYEIREKDAEAINTARSERRRITAVGTTSLRALESAAIGERVRAGAAETRLFITPGYRFQMVDRLLTNFHLPKSTLLMLVSAFAGMDLIRAAYRHAIDSRYRFFSYGDAMLLEREK